MICPPPTLSTHLPGSNLCSIQRVITQESCSISVFFIYGSIVLAVIHVMYGTVPQMEAPFSSCFSLHYIGEAAKKTYFLNGRTIKGYPAFLELNGRRSFF